MLKLNPETTVDFKAQVKGRLDAINAEARLRSFVERLQRLEEDKKAVQQDLKEVMMEAKGEGFDTKIIKKVLKILDQSKADYQEEQALIDMYLNAIGEA